MRGHAAEIRGKVESRPSREIQRKDVSARVLGADNNNNHTADNDKVEVGKKVRSVLVSWQWILAEFL